MVTTSKPTPICVPPSYSCFFEQAEHVLETLFEGREPVIDDTVADNIRLVQQASTFMSCDTVNAACQLKALKRRVRVGMLFQPELVEAFQRISVKL